MIANDAATLPASLHGVHVPSGAEIEVRLAGRAFARPRRRVHVVLGGRVRRAATSGRAPRIGRCRRRCARRSRSRSDRSSATVESLLDHPRLVSLRFDGPADAIWAGLARHGRPIQYAHVPAPLALWDVWTPIAGLPVAFEPPSAGFALDWRRSRAMRERGVAFATLTLAAGISSTGDPELDRAAAVRRAVSHSRRPPRPPSATRERQGGRIVAVGTTVVRALEHAAARDGVVHPGDGLANQRVGPATALRVVDAILSGTHEPDSSHYQLLRAFADDATLADATAALDAQAIGRTSLAIRCLSSAAIEWSPKLRLRSLFE